MAASTFGSSLPFDPQRGLVEVQVTIDGKVTGTFGIDTGADQFYIDRTFARENNLNIISRPSRPVTGVKGISKASPISIKSLQIGDEVLTNIKAIAIDMTDIIKDKSAGMPDGVIGYQILKGFYITIDYPNKTILLEPEKPEFLNGNKYHEYSFEMYRHLILVDAIFEDEIKAPMILDYCASFTSISKSLADKLDIQPSESKYELFKSVKVSDVLLSNNVAFIINDFKRLKRSLPRAEFEGILGSTFLYQHKITIDYKNKLIYIHN